MSSASIAIRRAPRSSGGWGLCALCHRFRIPPSTREPAGPGTMAGAVGCPGPPRPASENGCYVKFDPAAWAGEAPPPLWPAATPRL